MESNYSLSPYILNVNRSLFPYLEECLPIMTQKHREVIYILEFVCIERYVKPSWIQWYGRKRSDRGAMARAFLVKAIYNLPTTKLLVELLNTDSTLRQLCGWEIKRDIPSESTFSRAFAEFAKDKLLDKVHYEQVIENLEGEVVHHISRDSTAIEARESPKPKINKEEKPKGKRGRPGKGEIRPAAEPTRLTKQVTQTAEEAISEIPVFCDVGTKKNAKGYKETWIGYKLHIDVADECIPLLAVTTSASVHDSQAAIPMAKMTACRIKSLYDLMDSAYDAKSIYEVSRALGHVPIIDSNKRRGNTVEMEPARRERYKNRTVAERFNSLLKDCYGGKMVRVKGYMKVHTHLMFGVLVIFAKAVIGLLN